MESFLLTPSRVFPMSHTTDYAYMFQVTGVLATTRGFKTSSKSDVTSLYSNLCYKENVLDYVPLAELKMATKVF